MTRELTVALVCAMAAADAGAQAHYPERPVRLVVGFPAGSLSDVAARLLAQQLTETLGKAVVVEVIPGAAGNIAAERVARATPDGHTILMAANTQLVVNPTLYKL